MPEVVNVALRLDRGRPWLSSALWLVRDRFSASGELESGGVVDMTSLLANTSRSANETTTFARELTKAHELNVTDLCDTHGNLRSEMRHGGRFNWLLIDPNPSPGPITAVTPGHLQTAPTRTQLK